MINREIPFRPRLEGEFRVRFYNAASEITEKTPTLTIASKREVLTADILKKAIEKLTDSTHYTECAGCPLNENCEDYYKEFMKCIEKGMTYCAFSIRLHEQTPELYAKIKITI